MKVLVIEDDVVLGSSLKRSLIDEGYECDLVDSAQAGIELAISTDYQVVLLDIMLPDMSGWSVLYEIRKIKNVPVIMLSALNEVEDRVKGLKLGADDYLTKPYHLDELLARIQSVVRRNNLSMESIVIGPVTVSLSRRNVFLDGESITISPKEFSIMEILLENQGSPVSRFDIHNRVFNEKEASNSNIVDVYISNLRSKLGKECINTVRGKGYCIP